MIRLDRRSSAVVLLLAAVLVATVGSAGALAAKRDRSPAPSASAQPGASAAPEASAAPSPAASAVPVPTFDADGVSLRLDLFTDGLDMPVYVTGDGTGSACLYVVERGGIVRLVGLDGYMRVKPFLDISALVTEGTEQGLHAIAFHPDFARNDRFFAHYNDKQGRQVIAEFRGESCRGARGKPTKVLLAEEQPYPNNNAGWIGFGPDGYLYVPLGDGGGVSPGDPNGIGQSPTSRLSKVLRLNVDVASSRLYSIPPDNPYAKKRQGYPPETWAMGLRDPRRASFDRKTGDLWIGDVGQDAYEEIDRIPAGTPALNFGWSDMEGDRCHNLADCDPADYESPVAIYDEAPPQCGVVGGYVYRGKEIRALEGVYLFTDFCSGYIWGLDADAVEAGQDVVAQVLLDAPQGFVSFGEDDAGELYLVTLDGSIYKVAAEQG